MRITASWLLLLLLLSGCPQKSEEELGAATPIDAPVEVTPVLLPGIESQIPEGIDDFQILMIEWQGMKPHGGVFERFVRGKCYVRANYAFAEGGMLVQVAPLHRSGETGEAMDPKAIAYSEALGVATQGSEGRHQRDSLGALSWVWKETESGNEKIWTFTYPEPGPCVPPGLLARHTIPAKMKPTQIKAGPLPGETPSDPSRGPLAPTEPEAKPATEAPTEPAAKPATEAPTEPAAKPATEAPAAP